MKIGISTWVWISPLTTEALDWVVPHIAELGFDWIEVPVENPHDFDYSRAAQLIQAHDLGISVVAVMTGDRDLLHRREEIRENGARYVRHCIDAANACGATRIVGPFYSAVGRLWVSEPEQRAQEMELLVPRLIELADYAGEHDVELCVEPVNRFETSFINTAAQAVELVDRVEHTSFKVVLDTFHMNIEERSIGDAIRSVGPRLRHMHAGENDRGIIGRGHTPWKEIAQALNDVDYDGALVIETFSNRIESIAAAAAIWRPLAPSQDLLAREGLAFLRRTMQKQSKKEG
jgi:D-psicose/D-tagatose/L-ribulose 3-epimerase